MLQTVFSAILLVVLLAAVGSIAWMGFRQHRRTQRWARRAVDMGFRFVGEDDHHLPARYADFALIRCGHSPRANNVMTGQVDGMSVRAFDFRFEVAHGTRRASRHYEVFAAELPAELPPVVMWNSRDEQATPLDARPAECEMGIWSCLGPPDVLQRVADAMETDGSAAVSVQSRRNVLMLCAPAQPLPADPQWAQLMARVRNAIQDRPETARQGD